MISFEKLKKIPTEFEEQCIIFNWAALNTSSYPCLKFLFSTLNGLRLPIGLAMKAKRSGLKSGVPDLCLPMPKGGFCGLYIELKRSKGGTLSPEQKDFGNYLNGAGYKWIVAHGAREAVQIIKDYLQLT
jgi:hypothetical protein